MRVFEDSRSRDEQGEEAIIPSQTILGTIASVILVQHVPGEIDAEPADKVCSSTTRLLLLCIQVPGEVGSGRWRPSSRSTEEGRARPLVGREEVPVSVEGSREKGEIDQPTPFPGTLGSTVVIFISFQNIESTSSYQKLSNHHARTCTMLIAVRFSIF